jgi:hypothetical protein
MPVIALPLLLFAARSGEALACAVCGVGQEDPTTNAFLLSTALLSLIPFAMIGSTVYYFYRASTKARLETATDP